MLHGAQLERVCVVFFVKSKFRYCQVYKAETSKREEAQVEPQLGSMLWSKSATFLKCFKAGFSNAKESSVGLINMLCY